jgi:hypothetical protein
MHLRSMLRGEGHVAERVMLGLVHYPAEFLEPGAQLIGEVPPDLFRRLAVGLDAGLADAESLHADRGLRRAGRQDPRPRAPADYTQGGLANDRLGYARKLHHIDERYRGFPRNKQ